MRSEFEDYYFNKNYKDYIESGACRLKVFKKFSGLTGSESNYNGKYIDDRVCNAHDSWQNRQEKVNSVLQTIDWHIEDCNTINDGSEYNKAWKEALEFVESELLK